MADTLKNTIVKSDGTWYNAFSLISVAKGSAVAVGTAIAFSLLTEGEIWYCVAATEPENDDAYDLIRDYGWVEFETGETGVWIKAPYGPVTINFKKL